MQTARQTGGLCRNGSFINWKSSGYIPYYNLQEEFDAFNFFAYYYDNAQVGEVKREADRICSMSP